MLSRSTFPSFVLIAISHKFFWTSSLTSSHTNTIFFRLTRINSLLRLILVNRYNNTNKSVFLSAELANTLLESYFIYHVSRKFESLTVYQTKSQEDIYISNGAS